MQVDSPYSDALARDLLGYINDAVIAIDQEHRIVYLNAAAEAQYGLSATAAVGQPLTALYRYGWMRPGDEQEAQAALERDGAWRGENIHVKRSGEQMHVELRITRLRDRANLPIGLLIAVRDITAQRRAEADLRLGEQRLRMGVMVANLAMWTQDTDLRFTWAHNLPDPADGTSVIGRTDAELLPPAEAERIVGLKRRVLGTGRGARFEISLPVAGRVRCWDIAVEPLRGDTGSIVGLICSGFEITGRKAAETALRDSEARFRSTFENAAVGIAHVGLDGRWLRVNDMLCQILGYARGELLGMSFQDLTHPDDLAASLEQAESLISGKAGAYCTEKRFHRGDRSVIWVRLTVSLVRDDGGQPVHFISVLQDITDQKRAADEIGRQRAAFRRLAENSPEIISRFDREYRYVYVNGAIRRVTGLAPARFFGRTSEELGMAPELCARWRTVLRSVFERAETLTFEFALEHGGQHHYFSAICVPEFDERGQVETILSIARDVTELRHSAELMRLREGRLNLAIEAARLGVFEWRLSTGEIHCQNDLAHDILGLKPHQDSIPGNTFLRELLQAGAAETFERTLAAAATSGTVFRHVCLTAPRDGDPGRWVEFVGRFEYAAAARPERLIGFVADITERITAAQQLSAARDAAEAADRAKDRFLAALSHELRTPLTPALVMAEELHNSADIPERLRHDCAVIRTHIELEARLIDDLLDIARIRHGKLLMSFGPCDAHTILQRALETVKGDFSAQRIDVTVRLDAGSAPLHGDPVRLQQVFWNLLRNAAKFTPAGGRVTITTSMNAGTWRLALTDTGPGINADDLARIFESFVQVGDKSATRSVGLGLGLAISASLVREHHGRIWAESEGPGRGSTFLVELPLGDADSSPASIVAETGDPGRALGILLVEDHAATRETFVGLLQRRGHRVAGAGSVAEAISAARTGTFDLVISDLGLPDGDGYALMRQLHRDHGLRGIALSGYGMETDIGHSVEAGFLLHLVKPVKFSALEKAVADVALRL